MSICLCLLSMNIQKQYSSVQVELVLWLPTSVVIIQKKSIKKEDFKGNAQTKDKQEKQTLLTSMIFPNENRAVFK